MDSWYDPGWTDRYALIVTAATTVGSGSTGLGALFGFATHAPGRRGEGFSTQLAARTWWTGGNTARWRWSEGDDCVNRVLGVLERVGHARTTGRFVS